MSKRSRATNPRVKKEIERIQRESRSLAGADVALTQAKHAHGTVTLSVRMTETDVQTITSLAEERGLPVSHLVREWILGGLASENQTDVRDALQDFERSFTALRRAIRSGR